MPQAAESNVCHAVEVETVCAGNAWEMGFAQGERLREKIHMASSILAELEVFQLQKPKWMPLSVFRWIAEIKAGKFLSQALTENLPSAHERILGLAEGAEIRPRTLALLNVMEAVMSDISRLTVVPIAAACSALAVTGQASRTGDPILAHNFDYFPAVRPLYTVRESRPAGKLRSLEFTAAPLGGAVDGVNEAGLCVTYNYAYVTDGNHAGPTISMWIAEALSGCRTVPEAVEFLKKSKRWGGGLLMLGDAEGNIASLELSNTKSSVRSKPSFPDRLFHTNRFHTDAMKPVEVVDSTIHSDRAPRALRGRRVHQSSSWRDRRFQERLAAVQQLDAAGMIELMSDHGPEGEPSADSICMHSDYWHTTACLQLFPKERKLRVAYDTACRAKFVDFAL